MYRRNDDHRCAAVISNATPLDIIRRLQEYQRGYTDGQGERRSG
jgi:hypothetical protein